MEKGDSSRSRGKKGSSSDKPRQPQRGMGVAQLEKIRLHNQLIGGYLSTSPGPLHSKEEEARVQMAYSLPASSIASTSSRFGHSHSLMVGFEDLERTGIRHNEPQSAARKHQTITNRIMSNDNYHFVQPTPTVTLPLLRQSDEDWACRKRRQDQWDLNSDSSDAYELDLDLKLSR